MAIAVCPGSFDPITFGHIDIIKKSSDLFEKVFVLVAHNAVKTPMFTPDQRVLFAQKAVNDYKLNNVEVVSYDGLLATFCQKVDATVIVKGIRQGTDYDNEIGMALLNRKLSGVETIFIPADVDHLHISSTYVKDVAVHGGDISSMVTNSVKKAIYEAIN